MASTTADQSPCPQSVGIVGAGRLGRVLAAALRAAEIDVVGPTGRGEAPRADAIVLCVPDAEIETAAAAAAGAAPLVGHTSGATPLSALAPAEAQNFGLHPLQTFAGDKDAAGDGEAERFAGRGEAESFPGAVEADRFAGAGCAVAGSTPRALATARALAERLGMRPFELADEHRAAYHAAASIASNFLVTVQSAAEEVAGAAGLEPSEARALLAPLVRSTVENWVTLGPERALTGPVARGDEATVARQRDAVAEAAPRLLALFDELVERTRDLSGRPVVA